MDEPTQYDLDRAEWMDKIALATVREVEAYLFSMTDEQRTWLAHRICEMARFPDRVSYEVVELLETIGREL